MQGADSNYGISPWMQAPPERVGLPNRTYEMTATGEALSAPFEPSEEIRLRRPPLPIPLFPPRFGYDNSTLGIADVARLDDRFERRDFSGRKSGYEGTSTPSQPVF